MTADDTIRRNVEEFRDLVDEGEVLRLLGSVSELITPEEEGRLRDCAARALAIQLEANEIILRAAGRGAESDGEEANRRTALAHWFLGLSFEAAAEEARAQVATPN